MAKAGFWLQGARGKLKGSSLKGQPGGATIIAGLPTSFTNPNTAAQQGVRSSFKLISQLASQLAGIIAIPREGAKSSRNIFTSINYPNVYANEAGASVVIEQLQITKSNIKLPSLYIGRNEPDQGSPGEIEVNLTSDARTVADKVVYILGKITNGTFTKVNEAIVQNAGQRGVFGHVFEYTDTTINGDIVVFAYGIKLENEAARTKYENLAISSADEIAQVIVSRKFTTSEMNVTQTSGAQLGIGQSENDAEPTTRRVFINKGGLKGTTSGAGYYAAGASVTLKFTPADSKQHFTAFAEEDENGGYTTISSNNPATFTMPDHDVNVVVRGYTTNA